MASGRKPDTQRRATIARLRARGLTMAEIGRRLGVTRQAVYHALAKQHRGDRRDERAVPCAACAVAIASAGALASDAGQALCLRCLASRPDAPLGTRLKAFRLAAGLTKAELAKQVGLTGMAIHLYEANTREPRWRQLMPLLRVLGPGLVTLGLKRAR
jgi:transcriptional regulator with XRE-family HTH domain